jgi:transposase-like protein
LKYKPKNFYNKWSKVFYMTSTKKLAPIDGLFDQGYKLSYYSESLSKYEKNHLKSIEKDYNVFKSLNTWYKRDIFHIEMLVPFCPKCFSKFVIKNGVKERKLYFYHEGVVNSEIQMYKCKKCGKNFKTDITNIVDDNSNFTHEFKEKCIELAGLFFGSIRKIAYKIKKDTGISISRQTIENWILGYENQEKETNNRYSGYYIFDVEWIKLNSVWNYRFTLFDSKQNIIVADEIYSEENSTNIKKFLEESTRNKKKIVITSDLAEKYKPIIEELGFKHQWCLFHVFKNINKKIKDYMRDNELFNDDINKIREEKLELFSLFDSKSFKKARSKMDEIINQIKDYSKVIQSVILSLFMPYFKTLFTYLEDENIERTSNKLENQFQKTFPKTIKRIMKIKKGAMSRINIRKEILNQIKVFGTQPPSF